MNLLQTREKKGSFSLLVLVFQHEYYKRSPTIETFTCMAKIEDILCVALVVKTKLDGKVAVAGPIWQRICFSERRNRRWAYERFVVGKAEQWMPCKFTYERTRVRSHPSQNYPLPSSPPRLPQYLNRSPNIRHLRGTWGLGSWDLLHKCRFRPIRCRVPIHQHRHEHHRDNRQIPVDGSSYSYDIGRRQNGNIKVKSPFVQKKVTQHSGSISLKSHLTCPIEQMCRFLLLP